MPFARLQDWLSGQNESTALPDLSRIVTQVTAKGRAWGRNTGVFHVRSFTSLLRRFCPSRKSFDVACVFESFCRLVQRRSPDSRCARLRGKELFAATRQVDGARSALGLSFGRPPQMLVPGCRGDRDGEEAGSSSRGEAWYRRSRGERDHAARAGGGRGCACGAAASRTGGNVSADAARVRSKGG